MSRSVFQPVGQKRLTNIAVVRLKKAGKRFEIACYRNKVADWRAGIEKDLDEVLQTTTVFLSVAKGVVARDADLKAAFGTTDHAAAAAHVLLKGELQVSDRERRADLDALFKDVAGVLAEKTVDPRTGRPFTLTMLERALRDAGFGPDPRRAAKAQALETALPLLQRQFPIERARMLLRLTVAKAHEAALMDALGRRGARVVQVTEQQQQQQVSAAAGAAAAGGAEAAGLAGLSLEEAAAAAAEDVTMVSVTAQVDPAAFRELHALVVSGSPAAAAAAAAKARDKQEARRRKQQREREQQQQQQAESDGGGGKGGGGGGESGGPTAQRKKGQKGIAGKGGRKGKGGDESGGEEEEEEEVEVEAGGQKKQAAAAAGGASYSSEEEEEEEDEDEAVAAAAAASTAAAAQAGGARRGRVEVLSFAVSSADAGAIDDLPSSALAAAAPPPAPPPPPPAATAPVVPRPRELAPSSSTAAPSFSVAPAPPAPPSVLLYPRGPIASLPEEHASRRERFAELDALQAGWTVELRRRGGEGAPVDAAFWSPSGESVGSYANARRQALAASKAAK